MKQILPILFLFLFATSCQSNTGLDFAIDETSTQTGSLNALPATTTELTFKTDTLILELGDSQPLLQSLTFQARSATRDDILWFINNETIVSLDDNSELHALALGTTTIKASYQNVSDVIQVTVIAASNPFDHIQLAQNYGLITSPEEFEILFNYEDQDSTYTNLSVYELNQLLDCDIDFENHNPDILRVHSAGFVTPLNNGFANVDIHCGEHSLTLPLVSEAFFQESTIETNETLLNISFTVNEEYEIGDSTLLTATLEFDSGTVNNIVQNYTTPEGRTGRVTWNTSDANVLHTLYGTAYFRNLGEATITVSAEGESFEQSVTIKMANEEPSQYLDHFLGYDDFPGHETWGTYDCPFVTFGSNAGYASHLCPEIIMNVPYGATHTLSLGRGGEIILELNGYYPVDGVGPDFTIFENPILNSTYGYFAERAQVSVSQDGQTYYDFDCDAFDEDLVFAGCAGVGLVDEWEDPLDPSVSGGDQFDLADVGLSYIRFIKITDLETCVEGDITYETTSGQTLCSETGKEGFDLDAIAILNGERE